jgi:hypothetical protein
VKTGKVVVSKWFKRILVFTRLGGISLAADECAPPLALPEQKNGDTYEEE